MVSTPLLDEYRKHIAAASTSSFKFVLVCAKTSIDDKSVLRSIDFASHRSLIEDEHFQNTVLHRKAKALAERHLDILTPFISEKSKTECTEILRVRLEGIFTVALGLKVLVMATKDMFECIWPTPGSEFDVDTMETAQPRRQGIDQYDWIEGSRVVLPVAPGLRLYSHDRELVDYNGFIEVGDCADGQPRVIAKSVVYI
jgi:hypothetical protein